MDKNELLDVYFHLSWDAWLGFQVDLGFLSFSLFFFSFSFSFISFLDMAHMQGLFYKGIRVLLASHDLAPPSKGPWTMALGFFCLLGLLMVSTWSHVPSQAQSSSS